MADEKISAQPLAAEALATHELPAIDPALADADKNQRLSIAQIATRVVTEAVAGVYAPLTGGWEMIGTPTSAVSDPYVTFVCDDTKYEEYWLAFWGVVPVGANGYLGLRTSTNGGAGFDSGGSDYRSAAGGSDSGYLLQEDFVSSFGFLTRSQIQSTTDYPVAGHIFIESPQTALRTPIRSHIAYEQNAGTRWCHSPGVVWRDAAAAFDAFAIFFPNGATITGEFRWYGRRKP